MSIKIKRSQIHVKNSDGEYVDPINAVYSGSIEEAVVATQAAASAAEASAAAAEAAAGEAESVLESIPEDYTDLADEVSQLSESIVEIQNDVYSSVKYDEIITIPPVTNVRTGVMLKSGEKYIFEYETDKTVSAFASPASSGGSVSLNFTLNRKEYTPNADGELTFYAGSEAHITVKVTMYSEKKTVEDRLSDVETAINGAVGKVYAVGTGGDFNTLTSAFTALKDDISWKTLKIKGGTYDIFEELGGTGWLTTLTGSENWYDVSTFVPLNTKLIGIGMVTLNFNLPDTTPPAVAGLLSCLNVAGSVYMENITINCDNCRYGIHDEYVAGYGTNANTSHTYKNVKIDKKRTAVGSTMAFGCGQNENEQFLFEDCVFLHAMSGSAQGLLMHNRYANDNTSVIIRNSVMQGYYAGVKFGNVVDGSHIKVTISNSIIRGTLHDVVCEKQSSTSPATSNVYDVTLIKCGDDTRLENSIGAGYDGIAYN